MPPKKGVPDVPARARNRQWLWISLATAAVLVAWLGVSPPGADGANVSLFVAKHKK